MGFLRRILLIGILIFILLEMGSISTQAEGKPINGYGVTETILKTKSKPGEPSKVNFSVTNSSGKSTNVKIEVRDFEMKDKQLLFKEDVSSNWSVSKWTQVKESSFKLGDKQSKEIELNISVPKDAEMGEHTALVAIQFIPDGSDSNQKGNVKVATQIMPVLYVTVTDQNGAFNLIKKWALTAFTYSKDQKETYTFKYDVKNSGNVHLESQGKIEIENILNGSKKNVDVPKVNLLANANKTIAVQWKPSELFGIYNVKSSFSMDGERFESSTTRIYNIPWVLVGGTITIILLIILAIRFYLVSLKKRMFQEAKRQILSERKDESGNF